MFILPQCKQPALWRVRTARLASISFAAVIAKASSIQRPFLPNVPQQYRFELPNINHVFLPGHRIMIQIQSTLFPVYDRNPQTFVPNIFNAKASDYQKASITILRSKRQATAIWLPVVN